ncbi:MAG: hydroxyacid dehydrogenase [Candidatus Aminicenantes bacterium]|nr:hydroxyacid dehydrogenase [Candidatus Aminicenantes bacterium]
MKLGKVFVPEEIAASGLRMLKARCDCIAPWEVSQGISEPLSDTQMKEFLYESEAVVIRLFSVTADDLKRATRLKVIAKHGVGVDSIDCQAATTHGIPVTYTPTAVGNGVAEHVLALMLGLARRIVSADTSTRDGSFDRSGLRGVELAGKTLGILGLGRIGCRVAEKASRGLEMEVLAYDPLVSPDQYDGPAVIEDSVESVLRKADYLTLHIPLTAQTRHLINSQRLALMKSSARIINTSRGAVIDEAALAEALGEGTIAGAALDVFEREPLPEDHPLCQAPNTLLTPHIAGATVETLDLMSREAALAILDVLAGRRPEYVVNPEIYGA